ncbi:MAG: 2-hydroxyacyl-CoA dehydratase family protein [Dehalococcoidia bacterium]|jgi:benzoyl-CoA reductase/2-hydroxyglutaryl-CoA dehydratase subunit BcrC/BadD/HgdB
MEDKLKALLSAGNKENRTKWAKEWQKKGKKVIGVTDSLIPEEVIYAAGMLPWRIQGTEQADVSRAMTYQQPQANTFITYVMESFLDGELDWLDGVVCSNRDEEFLRLWDLLQFLDKTPLVHLIDIPVTDLEITRQRFVGQIRSFMGVLAKFGKVKVSDSSLRDAIVSYNKGRALLRKVYELRKREVPPLSGGEALAITTAAMVMPRDEFNKELEELLPYLEKRKAKFSHTRPRLLLSSDLLDNPAYIDLVEETGCLVAMDDLDNGSRYFWEMVDSSIKDPAYALAVRYLKNKSPRMLDWYSQPESVVKWAREFDIDGILDLPDMHDYTRGIRKIFFERRLENAGIPEMSFDRDYHLANVAQLKTRIGAFLETLETKTKG